MTARLIRRQMIAAEERIHILRKRCMKRRDGRMLYDTFEFERLQPKHLTWAMLNDPRAEDTYSRIHDWSSYCRRFESVFHLPKQIRYKGFGDLRFTRNDEDCAVHTNRSNWYPLFLITVTVDPKA